jgi:glucose dehydrogenase
MTYAIGGRQYLVIAAGGYKGDTTRGDYLIAYALPR